MLHAVGGFFKCCMDAVGGFFKCCMQWVGFSSAACSGWVFQVLHAVGAVAIVRIHVALPCPLMALVSQPREI